MSESRTGPAVGPRITVIPDSGNSGPGGWKIARELELSGLWIHVDQVNATGQCSSAGHHDALSSGFEREPVWAGINAESEFVCDHWLLRCGHIQHHERSGGADGLNPETTRPHGHVAIRVLALHR